MSWVLLRGLTREARHWGGFPALLASVAGSARASDQPLALDLPGNGEFCAQASPASVRAMVEFSRRQLLARGRRPPYSLLALSLGGMVAADWAQRHPREVARLVLINTSMRPFSSVSERLRPGSWPRLALLAMRWSQPEQAERLIHALTCRRTSCLGDDLMAWRRIRTDAPVGAVNAARQLWAAARYASSFAPTCPTLVLSSSGDQLVHPRCSARLALAWRAGHHEHPWAGHDLPHDDAGWVCERIAEWLGSA